MTAADPHTATITKAIEILETTAEELRTCHSLDGRWVFIDPADARALDDYNEMTATAAALRGMLQP